jgi:hypothetical protein
VLHVPEMDGRYYSVQFTDEISGANFACVGKRTSGTAAGDVLVCEPNWTGSVPDGMPRIDVPHGSALVIGRVFVADDDECLDWLLILGPRHLDRILRIYVQHYNRRRPHRGLELQVPRVSPPSKRSRVCPTSNGEISSVGSSTST